MKKSLKEKMSETARNPKVRVGLSLAIAALGALAPDDSASYCSIEGATGDCEIGPNGNSYCSKAWWFGDCGI